MTATARTVLRGSVLACSIVLVMACDASSTPSSARSNGVVASPVAATPVPQPDPRSERASRDRSVESHRQRTLEEDLADPTAAIRAFLVVDPAPDESERSLEYSIASRLARALPEGDSASALLREIRAVMLDAGAPEVARRRAMTLLAKSDRELPRQWLVEATLRYGELSAAEYWLGRHVVRVTVTVSLSREQAEQLLGMDDLFVTTELLRVGNPAIPVGDVLPFLEDDDALVREAAAFGLITPQRLSSETAAAVRRFLTVAEELEGGDVEWDGFVVPSPTYGEQAVYRISRALAGSAIGCDVLRGWRQGRDRVADYASVALAEFAHDAETRTRLLELSRSASSLQLRYLATRGLGHVGTAEDLPLLRSLLTDDAIQQSCTGSGHPVRGAARDAIELIEARRNSR